MASMQCHRAGLQERGVRLSHACRLLQDGSRGGGGVHPMMRLIADAAPQRGEVAMRSGLPQEVRRPLKLCCSKSTKMQGCKCISPLPYVIGSAFVMKGHPACVQLALAAGASMQLPLVPCSSVQSCRRCSGSGLLLGCLRGCLAAVAPHPRASSVKAASLQEEREAHQ